MRHLAATLLLVLGGVAAAIAQSPGVTSGPAMSMYGDLKYPADFKHFGYVNPQAPKGGSVRLAAIGTFDTLNGFTLKGVPAAGLGRIYDTLTVHSLDEAFTQYGLIAETIESPADRSWVAFTLRTDARFHDGSSITAEDLIWTFDTLKTKGAPFYRAYYAQVTKAEKVGERKVKFSFGPGENRELPLIVGQLPVLPKAYWEKRDFEKTTLEPPLGNGAYKIESFEAGRSITYRRVKDYWAAKHPVNVGQENFDVIRVDYYRDFNVEWANKNLFFGSYTRTKSYFSNSELASSGLPSTDELKVLEPFRGKVPEEVFTKEYQPPATDGNDGIRDNAREALRLLATAGWTVKNERLVNAKGEPMQFEILLSDSTWERIALPYAKNLQRVGVTARVRTVDTAQYQKRLEDFDFDMTVELWGQSLSPGNEQLDFWSTRAAETKGTRNVAGVRDPVVDRLIELVIQAPDRKSLVARTRALDRVLLWGHYCIPHWHIRAYRVAYWDRFGRPAVAPKYGLGFATWWVDAKKDAAVGARKGEVVKP